MQQRTKRGAESRGRVERTYSAPILLRVYLHKLIKQRGNIEMKETKTQTDKQKEAVS